jgi:hypothetical protein
VIALENKFENEYREKITTLEKVWTGDLIVWRVDYQPSLALWIVARPPR